MFTICFYGRAQILAILVIFFFKERNNGSLVWWQSGFLPGARLMANSETGLSYTVGPQSVDGKTGNRVAGL